MDRVARDAHVEVALLGALRGSVRHVSGITKILEALPVGIPQVGVVFREIQRRVEFIFGVEFAFLRFPLFGFPFLVTIIPLAASFANDADMAAKDGLAKHVVGADGQVSVLAREIDGLGCDDGYRALWKMGRGEGGGLGALKV